MLELLLAGGMDIIRAMRLLVPPAWQNNPDMDPELRAFFDFNSMHMEPWDGPAGIVMSDGRFAACNLDRNGLRPARYVITKDKLITCASEVGIWDYQPDEVVEKGRVGPGELMVIDTRSGRILHSAETDDDLKSRHPYKEWMEKNVRRLVPFEDLPDEEVGSRELDDDTLASYQKQFNYSAEELDSVIRVLGENGQEAVGSMGDDTPFAVLSSQPRIIYDYFRQQFAQVTNPPIDPLREAHVMSLATSIGREMNVFCEAEGQAHRLSFKSPILLYSDFKQLTTMKEEHYRADTLDITFDVTKTTLEATVKELCDKAEKWYVAAPCCWCSPTGISLKIACRFQPRWRLARSRPVWSIKACVAMPTSSSKPPAPAIRTTSPCCWASARRLFIHTLPMKRWAAW